MRVPVGIIASCFSKPTFPLAGSYKIITTSSCVSVCCRTSHKRFKTLHSVPRHPSGGRYYSTQNVTFDSQPHSWLFVSSAVAGAYGAQVNLELDLDNHLTGVGLEKLKSNLKHRGVTFDIDDLVNSFEELRALERQKSDMSAEKRKILNELNLLKDEKDPTESMKQSAQNLHDRLQKLKKESPDSEHFWAIEEKVMHAALKLPNDLHESTPVGEDLILREVSGKIGTPSTMNHIEIAEKFDLIKFSNVGPKAYYLKRELALAELALIETVCAYLESKKYRHMAGPEFFKTPVMEGCGRNIHDPDEVLTMMSVSKDVIEPMNHLAGVSLPMFAGFVAKTNIGNNVLPLNMFACGRCYQNDDLPGLFGAVQSTQTGLFSCVKKDDLDSQFSQVVDVVWDFLEPLGFPLRLIQVSARGLRREERRRFEVQMHAPSLHQFVPVAHVSDLGDFVSRRLMVLHNQNHADIRSASLVQMVSGSLVNITSLLGIWMEYSSTNQERFSLCSLQSTQKP